MCGMKKHGGRIACWTVCGITNYNFTSTIEVKANVMKNGACIHIYIFVPGLHLRGTFGHRHIVFGEIDVQMCVLNLGMTMPVGLFILLPILDSGFGGASRCLSWCLSELSQCSVEIVFAWPLEVIPHGQKLCKRHTISSKRQYETQRGGN